MKKIWKLGITGWTAAAASLMMAFGSYAAAPDGASRPVQVTVVKDAPFYVHAGDEQPAGVLGYFQKLKVKETLNGSAGI